ncbi:MAG: STAS domain-containing protein [Porcipelethomonas sp.]
MSMRIERKTTDGNTIALSGRLDSSTAPELEKELNGILAAASKLVLDMENLEYISSAGLRVILKTQKALEKKDGLKLIHVPDMVREVFDITGFTEFLTIE